MFPRQKIALYITTILITTLVVGISIYAVNNYESYESEQFHEDMESREHRDTDKFDFLMQSGQIKMDDGRYEEALNEFELALKIIPNDSIVNVRILECSQAVFNSK